MTARPDQSPSWRRFERRPSPSTAAPATATAITGAHQGTPSGPTSVNEKIAVNATSTLMIGTSAAISAGHVRAFVRGGTAQRGDPRGNPE